MTAIRACSVIFGVVTFSAFGADPVEEPVVDVGGGEVGGGGGGGDYDWGGGASASGDGGVR